MDAVFLVFKYIVIGFFGLLGLMIAAALIFGDRIVKKWEFEAEFLNENNREFGEFDIELSRIEKKEPEFSFKATFQMRHESLRLNSNVRIYLDQLLVLEGVVKKAGRILLSKDDLRNEVKDPQTGQICRVVCSGQQLFTQEIIPD